MTRRKLIAGFLGCTVAASATSGLAQEAAKGRPAPATPARPAATPAPDPATEAKLAQILSRWEKESASVTTLYAEFEQADKLVVAGIEKKYVGKAYLKRPNLALMNLEKPGESGSKPKFFSRIICTGETVVEYSDDTKQMTIYPLPKDAQARALEEGPLPFLFDMRADAIQKRYRMVLKAESQKSYRIEIYPLQAIDRDAFSVAVLDLNKQTLLPDNLYTLAANRKDTQHYRFTRVVKNGSVPDSLFVAQKWKGYSVVENPSPDTIAAPGEAPAARNARPTAPSATRPSAAAPNRDATRPR